jgi:hypothetical protein
MKIATEKKHLLQIVEIKRVTSPSPSTEHKDYYYFQFQVFALIFFTYLP